MGQPSILICILIPRHFLIYPSSFILKHECYLDPIDYVLKNDNVVLMGVTKTKAWFSVTESLSETFGLNHYPFAFMSQYFHSQKILMVDHSTLNLVSKHIQKLQGNCILINNTGRSGSTLLCQVWYL